MLTPPAGPSSLEMVPALGALEPPKCEELLKRNDVGRLAFSFQDRVGIIPVHYVYDAGWIYGRTEPEWKLIPILRNRRVAFEVDEIQGMFSWQSVIVHGSFYLIEPDAGETEQAAQDTALRLLRRIMPTVLGKADPVPFRNQLFRISAAEVSGRFAKLGGTRIEAPLGRTHDVGATPKADVQLQATVLGAISRTFPAATSRIHVDAFDGIVALTGFTDAAADRSAIEREILALADVQAVVQQIETDTPTGMHPTPADIARQAIRELDANPGSSASNDVKVVVEHDWLRAEGTAPTQEARAEVIRRLRNVRGTRGVVDRIHVGPRPA
ncbi:MAG: pyridoxamine 5'-phosphate oxidase family protein [Gemmatimonadaceae bacterium]